MFFKHWPVLLVDDEPDVLTVSKLAMKNFEVYGLPLKDVIQEKFGDGIMSAIDFTLTVDRREDPKGNRHVKGRALLAHLRRGEVHRHPTERKLEAGIADRRAYPLARLFDFCIGQTHQGKAGQAIGQMHLYRDTRRFKPPNCAAAHRCKPHAILLVLVRALHRCANPWFYAPCECISGLIWHIPGLKQLQVCLAQSLLSVSSTADISQFH